MPKQLTTQNATITTAAVEVKALTISGRQVTQSVFRQLLDEPLIANGGTLNGVPWGTVNYHPDKCGDSRRQHWHIVWQSGEELRRARVDVEPSFDRWGSDDREFWSDAADAYVTAWVREWLHGRLDTHPLVKDPARTYVGRYLDSCKFRYGSLVGGAEVGKLALAAANAKLELESARTSADKDSENEWRQESLVKAEVSAQETLAALDAEVNSWDCTFDDVRAEYKKTIDAEAERRQRHRDVRTTLAQLPQLFIAV